MTSMEEMSQDSQLTTNSTYEEDSQLTFEELEEVVASPGSDKGEMATTDYSVNEGETRKR